MGVVVLMLGMWAVVYAIVRMALSSRAAAAGATAFVALGTGLVAANDHGQWWGQAMSLAALAVLLTVLAMTVRPRLG